MSTAYHNLSDYDPHSVPDASAMRFGIVVSEWNQHITGSLLNGALNTLKKHGAKDENILVKTVPGSFELTYGSAQLIKSGKVDAVIALGCVIRGDTPHFDYVCMGATQGITYLNATSDIPVIYGYNIIKEGPYSLAVFGGPKIRCIWDRKSEVTFDNFNLENMEEELYPFNLNLTLGVAITISRIFFDFRYEVGLHNVTRKITYDPNTTEEPYNQHTMDIKRRLNVLSFSVGVIF